MDLDHCEKSLRPRFDASGDTCFEIFSPFEGVSISLSCCRAHTSRLTATACCRSPRGIQLLLSPHPKRRLVLCDSLRSTSD